MPTSMVQVRINSRTSFVNVNALYLLILFLVAHANNKNKTKNFGLWLSDSERRFKKEQRESWERGVRPEWPLALEALASKTEIITTCPAYTYYVYSHSRVDHRRLSCSEVSWDLSSWPRLSLCPPRSSLVAPAPYPGWVTGVCRNLGIQVMPEMESWHRGLGPGDWLTQYGLTHRGKNGSHLLDTSRGLGDLPHGGIRGWYW